MSRVFFVTKDDRYNLDTAKRFGDIIFLKAGSPMATQQFINNVSSLLFSMNFKPQEDFIAFTGPALPMALFVACTLSSYDYVRSLIFDAKKSEYVERFITVKEKSNGGKEPKGTN